MNTLWSNSRHLVSFAKGETIPFQYSEIHTAGEALTAFLGVSFQFVLKLEEVSTIVKETGFTQFFYNGKPFIEFSIDTTDLLPNTNYQGEFWLLKDNHKFRIDYFILNLNA